MSFGSGLRLGRIVVGSALCCALAGAALAQTPVAASTRTLGPDEQLGNGSFDNPGQNFGSEPAQGDRPIGRVFGVPVVVNAPVASPYAQSAYRNYAGQPERSGDDLTAGFMSTP